MPSRHLRDHLRDAVLAAGLSAFQLDCRLVPGLSDAILAETGGGPAPADDAGAFLVRQLAISLDGLADSRFRTVARRGGFHESLLDTFGNLDESGPDLEALARLASDAPPRLAEPIRLYLEWRRQLSSFGLATTGQRVGLAADRAPAFRPGEPVWAYGFYDLTGSQRRLLMALGGGRPMRAYVPGIGGLGEAFARPARAWFEAWAEAVEERPGLEPPAEAAAWFDAAGERREVEEVARRVRRLVVSGVRPGRIAVVSRNRRPYGELVRDTFARAGLVAAGLAGEPLLNGPAGRGLRIFLGLAEREPSRRNVVDFLDLALAERDAAAVAALDELSRESGITRGEGAWRRGLERAARRGAEAARVSGAFAPVVAELFGALAAFRRATTFAAMAERLAAVVERWFAHDPNARAVRREVAGLADLDRLGRPPDAGAMGWLVERRLSGATSLPAGDREGVVTGDVVSIRGLHFEHLFVLGMTERVFPGPVVPDPILLDADRAALRGAVAWLPLKGSAADEEKLLFELAWQAAPARTLSWSRLDPATGRPSIASSFLLEAAARRLGHPVGFAELERTGARVPMDHLSEAREAGRRDPDAVVPQAAAGNWTDDALDDREFARMVVMAAVGADRPDRAAFLRADAGFDRRLEAAGDRWRPAFTARDGALADPDAVAVLKRRWGPGHTWSASELEKYAGCPMRFFLETVLGLGERPAPEDAERLPHEERGRLIHAILQEFLAADGAALVAARGGDAAARDALAGRLAALTAAKLDAYEETGVTGHRLLWRLDRERMALDLEEWLDFELARADRLVPGAFELRFGREPQAGRSEDPRSTERPAVLARPDGGAESLGGYIDRVDRSADGAAARVVDYKSGRPPEGKMTDPLDGGRRLQLAVYRLGLAAADAAPRRIDAEYLHLAGTTTPVELPDAAARALHDRLAADVALIADAIRGGFLPAWPEEAAGGRCRCPYPSVCGVQRGELFERKRLDPRFGPLASLDGDGAAGDDGAAGGDGADGDGA